MNTNAVRYQHNSTFRAPTVPMRRSELARSSKPMKRTPLRKIGRKGRLNRLLVAAAKAELLGIYGPHCQRCGAGPMNPEDLHPHHLKLRAQGSGHSVDDLTLVCGRCHQWIHDNPAESYASGWLIRRGAAASSPADAGRGEA